MTVRRAQLLSSPLSTFRPGRKGCLGVEERLFLEDVASLCRLDYTDALCCAPISPSLVTAELGISRDGSSSTLNSQIFHSSPRPGFSAM